MNNFEQHRRATLLADSESSYALAKRVVELEQKLYEMNKCAQESQDWNWISARERAEEEGQDFFEIPEMQELYEKAFKK